MEKIVAPYNFVPVSEHVFVDGSPVSHDVPYRDGITARITYKVIADTPLMVRGAATSVNGKPTRVSFFRTPDNAVAIPGSSIRGLLRNVIEIASFGRLSRVNDHTYGVRDLQNRDVYGQYMAEIRQVPDPRGHGTKPEPVPLVSAGWLRRLDDGERAALREAASVGRERPIEEDDPDDVVAEITPCHFYKIEYGRLMKLAQERGVRNFSPGDRQSSVRKYETWGAASRDVDVEVRVFRPIQQRSAAGVPFLGEAGVVVDKGAVRSGRLVFTGQPSPWRPDAAKRKGAGSAKHHDFVFAPATAADPVAVPRLLVTRKQFEVFEFVHAGRGQQNRLQSDPNEEWGFWKEAYKAGEKVPVFVLPERDGSLRAFGLAMMFRLAYRHGVKDAVLRAQPEVGGLDLAERIFGTVPPGAKEGDGGALRGRVSIGLATAQGKARELPPVTAVLGAPKASYYPNYVEQSDDPYQPGAQPSGAYRTFMDDEARVRGWKRYRPHAKANARPELPSKAKPSVMTEFAPVAEGTVFEGEMRVHNLRRDELGALVWAARFGGDKGAKHTLGMARSLGYGSVRVELSVLDPLRTNDDRETTLDECQGLFEKRMEEEASAYKVPGGWRGSLQVTQLLACAQPFAAGSEEARHMRIEPFNEFAEAKRSRLALAPAGDVKSWREKTGVPKYVAPPRAAVKAGAPAPGVTAPRGAPAAPSKPVMQVALTPTSTVAGKIRYFRNGEVALELADGRKVRAVLGKVEFHGFKQLNGNEFKEGRKVSVALATGDVVLKVEG